MTLNGRKRETAYFRGVGGVAEPDLVIAGSDEDERNGFVQGHILLHHPATA